MTTKQRKLLSGIVALALGGGLASIVAPPATAQVSPTAAIIINEVYGGGGNSGSTWRSDFIELYNTTGTAVNLSGWSVQYGSASGAVNQVTVLSGSIPAHGYYLVKEADGAGGTVPLPTPDATGTIAMSSTGGKVALVSSATSLGCSSQCAMLAAVVDFVGWGGANDWAGTGPGRATTNPTSVSRDSAHTNTADNAADFIVVATPTPRNSATPDPSLSIAAPTNLTARVGTEWVGVWEGRGDGTLTYSFVGTPPAGATIESGTGTVRFTPTTTGSVAITVQVSDGTNSAQASVTITVLPAADEPLSVPAARAVTTGQVTTRGVVTASYPTGGFNGFVIQEPGSGGADYLATATGSQAIFVYLGASLAAQAPAIGTYVEVTGDRGDYYGLEQITVTAGTDITQVDETVAAPVPVTDAWPAAEADRAKLMSMLYQPAGTLTVSNTYDLSNTTAGSGISSARYGEVGLAFGDSPLRSPTDMARPNSAEAQAVHADNQARRIILDDGSSSNYVSTQSLRPAYYSDTNPVRVGASVTVTMPMIVDWRFSDWKLEPTSWVSGEDPSAYPVSFANTRTPAPDQASIGDADLTVASFNVLNYFTTTGEKWESLGGGRSCGYYYDATRTIKTTVSDCSGSSLDGVANSGPRGAADAASLARQQSKIVAAINALDADIVGLLEIENSSRVLGAEHQDEAIATLVDALNDAAGGEKWAYVPSNPAVMVPAAQQDVITQALIYQPAAANPVGEFKADTDTVAFANARKPFGQAFEPAAGGEVVFVTPNHLKSKGSGTADPCPNDPACSQGAANDSRIAQATELARWVSEDVLPSYSADLGREVTAAAIIGDINAYTFEDPMQVLKDAGYTDVNEHEGNTHASYSFSGMSGSLDHVLLNAAAMERYTGSDIWNINAGEALWLEYSRYGAVPGDLFNPATPYRSSDHDPIIAGLQMAQPLELAAPSGGTIAQGEIWRGIFLASGGSSPYTFALVDGPDGATIDPITGEISYTPPPGTVGDVRLAVEVTDARERTAQAWVVVRVVAPLSITAPGAGTTAPGESWLGTFVATGGVGPYTFSLLVPPSGVSIDPSTGEVTFAVPTSVSGTITLRVQVTDKDGRTASASVTITIKLPDTGSTCAPLDTPLFRFYKSDGTHFFTASASEAETVKGYREYKYEGIAGYIGAPNATPCADQTALYRFYKSDGTHFYTASAYEAELVKTFPQYTYEGVVGVVDTAKNATTAPVYRFYKFAAGTHFYTASDYERGQVMAYPEYRYEGISFYMRPSS